LEDNIQVDLRVVGDQDVNWIEVPQNDPMSTKVITVLNVRVHLGESISTAQERLNTMMSVALSFKL
jgi:hypothetical protein